MVKLNATDQIADFFKTIVLDDCEATTGWTALGNDTTGLATDLDHVYGTVSLEFDKVNGAANTIFGAIAKTIPGINVDDLVVNGEGFITWCLNLSSLAAITSNYAFIRLGTDSSNYNEWRIPYNDLKTGWNVCKALIGAPSTAGSTGNGWNSATVTYICVGIAFDAETSTLADIRVDRICLESCRRVSADITSEVSTSVSTGDINLEEVAGSAVSAGAGAVAAGTQRVILASDDPAVTNTAKIPSKGTAAMAGSTPVTIATDDTVLTKLTSAPVEKTPVAVSQFIAVASTAEALVASETFARELYLQAKKAAGDNTGNVFIGLSTLDQGVAELFELAPGDTYRLPMPAGTKVDLNDIYIDADNANDGVVGWYIPV